MSILKDADVRTYDIKDVEDSARLAGLIVMAAALQVASFPVVEPPG